MLLTLQIPLADSTSLLNNRANLLNVPDWSVSPNEDTEDFIRSFGIIAPRKKRGLPEFVNESFHCSAKRAVRLLSVPTFEFSESDLRIPIKVKFRRLFFNRWRIAGKFEIGFVVDFIKRRDKKFNCFKLTEKETNALVHHCLNFTIKIPKQSEKYANFDHPNQENIVTLGGIAKPLAKFYAGSRIKHDPDMPPVKSDSWWVSASKPLLSIVPRYCQYVSPPPYSDQIEWNEGAKVDLSHYNFHSKSNNFRLWTFNFKNKQEEEIARKLKLVLFRLNVEHETLRFIIRQLSSEKIRINRRSISSDILNAYLDETLSKISDQSDEAEKMADYELVQFARSSENLINSGEAERLLLALKKLKIEKKIHIQIEAYIKKDVALKKHKDAKNTYIETYIEYTKEKIIVEKQINVDNSGIGNITNIAEYMSGVTNTVYNNVNQSNTSDEIKDLIKELTERITAVAPQIETKTAEKLGKNVEALSKEVASTEPDRRWYEVSLSGLKEAAVAVGELGKPILETISKLTPLLLPIIS